MAANMVLLEKITVGAAGASSVVFNSIPQTGYTDLIVKYTGRANDNGISDGFSIQFNGTTTGYTGKNIGADGASVTSASGTGDRWLGINGEGSTASTFTNGEVYIPNSTSSNYKSYFVDYSIENNTTTNFMAMGAVLWSNTAAITSITLVDSGKTLLRYSTFYLYGVAKLGTTPAIAPYATGGDTIMTDGTYWYHAFKASGTFTPAKTLSCDVLVVAGGGSGGSDVSGGGGAGGVIAFAAQSLASGTGYTATIGAGGAGNAGKAESGTNGSNSQFGALTAAVGGGRGTALQNANGGSGGGTRSGASTPTSGQGNAGGGGQNAAPHYPAGGGGGAGSAGVTGVTSTGGNGGAGTNSVTNWGALSSALTSTGLGVSGYIAGGGGAASYTTAGAAGSGGATAGLTGGTTSNATANTGSGSGGTTDSGGGTGSGGSGLVIVRYAI